MPADRHAGVAPASAAWLPAWSAREDRCLLVQEDERLQGCGRIPAGPARELDEQARDQEVDHRSIREKLRNDYAQSRLTWPFCAVAAEQELGGEPLSVSCTRDVAETTDFVGA